MTVCSLDSLAWASGPKAPTLGREIETFTQQHPLPEGVELLPVYEVKAKSATWVDLGLSKKQKQNLRLVLLSDIHIQQEVLGYHADTAISFELMAKDLPKGDILIISGDLTARGSVDEIRQFRSFLNEVLKTEKFRFILFIPGNHDRVLHEEYYLESGYQENHDAGDPRQSVLEARDNLLKDLPDNVVFLVDQSIEIEGYKFFGTPWVEGYGKKLFHFLKTWAFSVEESALKEKWNLIPEDTDILITHMPPLHHGDLEPEGKKLKHTGSASLLERCLTIKPILHIFGHVHEGYGASRHAGSETIFLNSATCDHNYHPIQKPIVVDLPRRL